MEIDNDISEIVDEIIKSSSEDGSKAYLEFISANKDKIDEFHIHLINRAFEAERNDLVKKVIGRLNATKDACTIFIEKFDFEKIAKMDNQIIDEVQNYINNSCKKLFDETNKDQLKKLRERLSRQRKLNNKKKNKKNIISNKSDNFDNGKQIKAKNVTKEEKNNKITANSVKFEDALKYFTGLKKSNDDLKEKNKKLIEEKENLNWVINEKDNKIKDNLNKITKLEDEIENKKNDIKEKENTISKFLNENEELHDKISMLTKELEEYKEANINLQNDKEYSKQCYVNKLSDAVKKAMKNIIVIQKVQIKNRWKY